MSHTANRLTYLDGLRGMAAVIVVIHHLMIGFFPASYSRTTSDIHTSSGVEWLLHDTPLGIVINGGFAIGIFLLISGYVVSVQFQKSSSLKLFFRSTLLRFLRFFSLILSCNLISYLLVLFGQTWNRSASAITGSWWWLGSMWTMKPSLVDALSQSFLSLFRMYPIQEIYNSSLWTMPLFFMGPMMVFGILLLTKKIPFRWLIYMIFIGLLIKTNYYLLVVGMAIHDLQLDNSAMFRSVITKLQLAGSVLYFGAYPQSYTTGPQTPLYSLLPTLSFTSTSGFYLGLGALALFLLIQNTQGLQRFFSTSVFTYLGKISFSLYIIHITIINSLTSFLFIWFTAHFPYSTAFSLSVLLSVPVFFGASHLLYTFVEQKSKYIISR